MNKRKSDNKNISESKILILKNLGNGNIKTVT